MSEGPTADDAKLKIIERYFDIAADAMAVLSSLAQMLGRRLDDFATDN